MDIRVDFNIKKYKTAQSKAYIDVECAAYTDSDSADIFVIQKLPKNALGEPTSRFSHVADPVDMEDYPDKEQEDRAYFRTNSITLRVRNQFQVQHIIQTMRKQVKALAHALTAEPESEQFFSQTFTG